MARVAKPETVQIAIDATKAQRYLKGIEKERNAIRLETLYQVRNTQRVVPCRTDCGFGEADNHE